MANPQCRNVPKGAGRPPRTASVPLLSLTHTGEAYGGSWSLSLLHASPMDLRVTEGDGGSMATASGDLEIHMYKGTIIPVKMNEELRKVLTKRKTGFQYYLLKQSINQSMSISKLFCASSMCRPCAGFYRLRRIE